MESITQIAQAMSTMTQQMQQAPDDHLRDAQIVRIQTSQSDTTINLTQLLPSMFHVNQGNRFQQQLHYMIHKVYFPTNIYNVKKGDKIGLLLQVYFGFNPPAGQAPRADVALAIPYVHTFEFDFCATGSELAVYMNKTLEDSINHSLHNANPNRTTARAFAYANGFFEGGANQNAVVPAGNQMNERDIAYQFLFSNVKIIFDQSTNKFGILWQQTTKTIDAPADIFAAYNLPSIWFVQNPGQPLPNNYIMIRAFSGAFYIPDVPTLSPSRQGKLARMVGCDKFGVPSVSLGGDLYGSDLVIHWDDQGANPCHYGLLGDHVRTLQWDDTSQLDLPPAHFFGYLQVRSFFFKYMYMPLQADLRPYRHIDIRSTLQTNLWDVRGTSSNLIHRYYMTSAAGEKGEVIIYDTRAFQVRTSEGNLRGFTVQVTDEDSLPIDFKDDYVIEIAFFFK